MTLESWNTLNTTVQSLGAIFGFLAVLCGAFAIVAANRIGNLQEERLATAETNLEETRKQTEESRQGTALALAEAAKIKADSERDVASLTRQAEELRASAAEANERAATANKAAEEVRAESLALQRIMRPRRVYGNSEWVGPLHTFAGMKAVIFVIPDDFESSALANNIASVLAEAKWQPELRVSTREFDGLSVFSGTWPGDRPGPGDNPENQDYAWRAGEALANFLTRNFAQTETGPNIPIFHQPEEILPRDLRAWSRPEGVVAISVGMRPVVNNLLLLKYMKNVYGSPIKPQTTKPDHP